MYVYYGVSEVQFVLQSLNCLNLKWQLVEHVLRLRSKKAIVEVATSHLQK